MTWDKPVRQDLVESLYNSKSTFICSKEMLIRVCRLKVFCVYLFAAKFSRTRKIQTEIGFYKK